MIGIIYGALVALVQPDFKKLVAYSSVSHLGFVMLGIFALTLQSVQGALMVMINHGISTGALFLLIGMIYERRHTPADRGLRRHRAGGPAVRRHAHDRGAVAASGSRAPTDSSASSSCWSARSRRIRSPPTIAATGVILAAAYLLWAIQRILFNPLDKPENEHLPDLNWRELACCSR